MRSLDLNATKKHIFFFFFFAKETPLVDLRDLLLASNDSTGQTVVTFAADVKISFIEARHRPLYINDRSILNRSRQRRPPIPSPSSRQFRIRVRRTAWMSTTPPRAYKRAGSRSRRSLATDIRRSLKITRQKISGKLEKIDKRKSNRSTEPQDNWFLSRVTSLHARNFAYRSLSPAWGHEAKACFVRGRDRQEKNGRTLNRVTREAINRLQRRTRRLRASSNGGFEESRGITLLGVVWPKSRRQVTTNARTTVRPRIGNYPRNVHAIAARFFAQVEQTRVAVARMLQQMPFIMPGAERRKEKKREDKKKTERKRGGKKDG